MNTKRRLRALLHAGAFLLCLAIGLHAQAGVVIAGTRVVYNAPDRETTLKVTNKGKKPVLIQTWVDNGAADTDADTAPGAIDVPFTVAPPVARIEPDKAQTLRIFYTDEPLPQDKESVFWLNLLEIPPEPDMADGPRNYLQVAFRSRIKLFFRPAGLKGNAAEASAQLRWTQVHESGKIVLEARNPTPFHVSFAGIELAAGGQHAATKGGGMIAPGATQRFVLEGEVAPAADATVNYRAINDWGGVVSGSAALSQAMAPAR